LLFMRLLGLQYAFQFSPMHFLQLVNLICKEFSYSFPQIIDLRNFCNYIERESRVKNLSILSLVLS
jgi:hypothetical protein